MTSSRSHLNLNNSLAIRHEIQRFESVHPSIYAIYDLIELIPDQQIAQQIRDHVVCIEDSFVNSQEWTISRTVPDLRLGIVGSLCSGKSALVHRYLTGSYMQEESPEGGRFKKEIFIDGQSYLLLIRDEGGLPEMQFASWVDAVIFVFSLENEASYNAVSNYFTKLLHFRNSTDLPIILVGTQDTISERNPRVINDLRARALAMELKRCSYYETCATYGLNVERVFQDACQKIVQQRIANTTQCLTQHSRPTTPLGNNTRLGIASYHQPGQIVSSPTNVLTSTINNKDMVVVNCKNNDNNNNNTQYSSGNLTLPQKNDSISSIGQNNNIGPVRSADFIHLEQKQQSTSPIHHTQQKWCTISHGTSKKTLLALSISADALESNTVIPLSGDNLFPPAVPIQTTTNATNVSKSSALVGKSLLPFRDSKDSGSSLSSSTNLLINNNGSGNNLTTPTSTPTTVRKTRRRSNLFIPSSKKFDDKIKSGGGELGSGRSIPIKQGYLYKRSSKTLNKEWKKKYVTLCDDGRLTYHPSLHDYMDDVHGKEIILQCCTVKVPGQKPRGTKSILTNSILTAVMGNGNYSNSPQNNLVASNNNNNNSKSINTDGILSLSISGNKEKKYTEKVLLTAFDSLRDPMNSIAVKTNSQQTSADEGIAMSNSNSQTFLTTTSGENGQNIRNELPQTQYIKKRHRRMKSSSVKNNECDDSDGFEFFIISSDSKQYHFEAPNSEERDDWVAVIHQEISNSIQRNETTKTKQLSADEVTSSIQMIRTQVAGNGYCVDCEAPNPEWASLNLGILMCIECSGGHRNLGSHISKVRSLDLDDWPPGHLSVMLSIGNTLANSVWEATINSNRTKPSASSSSEEKQLWIRNKYEGKEFLLSQCKPPQQSSAKQQLSERLIDAVNRSDMKTIILLLANASSEHINSTVSIQDLRTPLHLACTHGNLAIAQLLIWHHADINQMDQDGHTCLWYAKELESFTKFNDGQQQQQSQQQQNSITKYSGETISALIDLLIGLGCVDRPQSKQSSSGTLPRRRETSSLERLPLNI